MDIKDATTTDLIRALQDREVVALCSILSSEPTTVKFAGPVLLVQIYPDPEKRELQPSWLSEGHEQEA